MDVDAAAHEFQALADVEQSESAVARGQAVDGVHLESHARVDDVERQHVVGHRAAHRGALRARMFDHVLQQLAHGLEQQHGDLVLERLRQTVVFDASR